MHSTNFNGIKRASTLFAFIFGGTIINLFLNIFVIAYSAAFLASNSFILNFTFATSSKFVLTGPGQNIDIFTL